MWSQHQQFLAFLSDFGECSSFCQILSKITQFQLNICTLFFLIPAGQAEPAAHPRFLELHVLQENSAQTRVLSTEQNTHED